MIDLAIIPTNCDDCDACCYCGVPPEKGATLIMGEPCTNLKDGKCIDYDNRPKECVDFEVGGEGCLVTRKMANENIY